MDDAKAFGTRLCEIRSWRELTLREASGLAGLSFDFWGQVERGEKAVNNRNTLEAMAAALRVAPTELTGQPYTLANQTTSQAHAVVTAVENALSDYELGEPPEDIQPRPWEAIAADLDRLNRDLRPRDDYAAQGALLPSLLAELHGHLRDRPRPPPRGAGGAAGRVPMRRVPYEGLGCEGLAGAGHGPRDPRRRRAGRPGVVRCGRLRARPVVRHVAPAPAIPARGRGHRRAAPAPQ